MAAEERFAHLCDSRVTFICLWRKAAPIPKSKSHRWEFTGQEQTFRQAPVCKFEFRKKRYGLLFSDLILCVFYVHICFMFIYVHMCAPSCLRVDFSCLSSAVLNLIV